MRVPKGKLDHLPNCCHLFSAASNIIIAHIVKFLLFFSIDGLSFSVEHSVRSDDTKLFGFSGHYFELYGFEVASDDKKVSFFDWTVGILEIRDEIGFGEVTTDSLNGIAER